VLLYLIRSCFFLHFLFQGKSLIFEFLLFLLTRLFLHLYPFCYFLLPLLFLLRLLLLLYFPRFALFLSLFLLNHFCILLFFLKQLLLFPLYLLQKGGSLLLSHLLPTIFLIVLYFSFDYLELVLELFLCVHHLDYERATSFAFLWLLLRLSFSFYYSADQYRSLIS
jgi:hypothetical protein